MAFLDARGFRVEHGVGSGLGAAAEVLLAEVLDLRFNRGASLQASSALRRPPGGSARTSCSSREIFCSFILWTPAWTEPARAVAASSAPFMVTTGCASEVSETGIGRGSATRLLLGGAAAVDKAARATDGNEMMIVLGWPMDRGCRRHGELCGGGAMGMTSHGAAWS